MNISPTIRAQHAGMTSTFNTMASYLPSFSSIELTDKNGMINSPLIEYYFFLQNVGDVFTKLIFERLDLYVGPWVGIERLSPPLQFIRQWLTIEYYKSVFL